MSAIGTTPCQAKSCPNGHPASKLECPTCNKCGCSRRRLRTDVLNEYPPRLGIRGSYFCGQDCFKADCTLPSAHPVH
jgi:methionyl aminopeptidase